MRRKGEVFPIKEMVSDVVRGMSFKYDKVSGAMARTFINVLAMVMIMALREGKLVTIPGFGSFKVIQRRARKAFDPYHKKVIKVPAKKVIKFKPNKKLLEAINK